MNETIKDLTESVPQVKVENKLFKTILLINKVQLTQYSMYFGMDAYKTLTNFLMTGQEGHLAKLQPTGTGPNRIELFIADDDSMAIFKFFQYIPHSYEPRTTWMIKSDASTCQALRSLVSRI